MGSTASHDGLGASEAVDGPANNQAEGGEERHPPDAFLLRRWLQQTSRESIPYHIISGSGGPRTAAGGPREDLLPEMYRGGRSGLDATG